MKRELVPAQVAQRLAELSALYVPETVGEARARLRREELASDAFASAVARRLEELRALDDLTRYLHGNR
jgi:hypothetical protein